MIKRSLLRDSYLWTLPNVLRTNQGFESPYLQTSQTSFAFVLPFDGTSVLQTKGLVGGRRGGMREQLQGDAERRTANLTTSGGNRHQNRFVAPRVQPVGLVKIKPVGVFDERRGVPAAVEKRDVPGGINVLDLRLEDRDQIQPCAAVGKMHLKGLRRRVQPELRAVGRVRQGG